MAEKQDLLEQIVLGEIEGKNRAIHAYDGIVWKIRSGFLTLLFGGRSILPTGIVENKDKSPADYQPLALGLFLFSRGFAFGARYVDENYIGPSSGWCSRSIGSSMKSGRSPATIASCLRSY